MIKITYRELSSLVADLDISAKMLYSFSNSVEKHYRKVALPKSNGEFRYLHVPDESLKMIQRKIYQVLLSRETVSVYATAYRYGGSTVKNAKPHIGREYLLKLDVKHFFDSIIQPVVMNQVFPADRYSEANQVLLSNLCCLQGVLPQGAPTSPAISNIVMKEFDDTVGRWCRDRNISFTRYCDDMTFSWNNADYSSDLISFVKNELKIRGYFLNEKKTVLVKNGQRKTVTGIVVNKKVNISSEYKRTVRQELFYCMKYGISSHLTHTGQDDSEDASAYAYQLLGKVNYILCVIGPNDEFERYRDWLKAELK